MQDMMGCGPGMEVVPFRDYKEALDWVKCWLLPRSLLSFNYTCLDAEPSPTLAVIDRNICVTASQMVQSQPCQNRIRSVSSRFRP